MGVYIILKRNVIIILHAYAHNSKFELLWLKQYKYEIIQCRSNREAKLIVFYITCFR